MFHKVFLASVFCAALLSGCTRSNTNRLGVGNGSNGSAGGNIIGDGSGGSDSRGARDARGVRGASGDHRTAPRQAPPLIIYRGGEG